MAKQTAEFQSVVYFALRVSVLHAL